MRKSIILTMATSALLVGCTVKTADKAGASDADIPENRLAGLWTIENVVMSDSVGAAPSETSSGPTHRIEFTTDGFYVITTNCNTINGSYTLSGTTMRMTDGIATDALCDEMATEDLLRLIIPEINTVDFESDSTIRLATARNAFIRLHR